MSDEVADRAIHRAIPTSIEERVLLWVGGRGLLGLRVHTDDDGVMLEGWAPTFYAKQLAQQAVMEITGLRVRANRIQVG